MDDIKLQKLVEYIYEQRDAELQSGAEMFMGTPDRWYEPPTWACIGGHISHGYLKSEHYGGDVCFACHNYVYLVPPELTEEQLQEILQ